MCGIVAHTATADPSLPFLLDALRRLEYRGYDSAGVAVAHGGTLTVHKRIGRVGALVPMASGDRRAAAGCSGIGHTRWATHGEVTACNAHPHIDCAGRLAIVHNGVIENAGALRAELVERGHAMASDIDSEVIAHLIEELEGDTLLVRVAEATQRLDGAWAIAVLDRDGTVVLAAHRSPLVLASTGDGSYVAASDVNALAGLVDDATPLAGGAVVSIRPGSAPQWHRERSTAIRLPVPRSVPGDELHGHPDHMAKEIAEQAMVAQVLVDRDLDACVDGLMWRRLGLGPFAEIQLLGCGTSLHAAQVTQNVLRSLSYYPTEVVVASEHLSSPQRPSTLTIAFSQSGETADVLAALELARGPVLAITNQPQSSVAQRADAVVDCSAGPEVGVAATKTFTAQALLGSMLALAVAADQGALTARDQGPLLDLLCRLPGQLRAADEAASEIAPALAAMTARAVGFLFLSRNGGMAYAREGALKLQELTYRWTACLPAGELKHGPLALVEQHTPVVVVEGGVPAKLESNIAEVRSRGAFVIRIGTSEDSTFRIPTSANGPWGPLLAVPAMQHLARELALVLGRDVDKPRNLAKSVTVE